MNMRGNLLWLAVVLAACGNTPSAEPLTPVVPASSTAAHQVVADGRVLPAQDATLNFLQAGRVAEVLVDEGDTVQAGQALIRLDRVALQLRVDQAQVALDRAQAKYDQLLAGAATESIAVAEAGVSKAKAAATQVSANVSNADITAAKAELTQAKQALANVLDPQADTRAVADAAVQQADANVAQQKTTLSAAKSSAKLAMDQATEALSQAQITYQSSKENWQYVLDNDRDPFLTKMKLSDAQKANYYDAMQKAESAMRVAESNVAKARVTYEQALQNEASGVQAAEATLSDAQARRDQVVSPDTAVVAAAQARVAAAEANLNRLLGSSRAAQLDMAAADVAQAEAQLAQVAAPPRDVDVAILKSEVDAAKVALDQAKYEYDQATLTAPFAGDVATIAVSVGEVVSPSTAAVTMLDARTWHVETEDLSELDVVHVAAGDAVEVTVDALPDVMLAGTVRQVQALGTNRQGDIVYTVVVDLNESDPRLRWNMTATIMK